MRILKPAVAAILIAAAIPAVAQTDRGPTDQSAPAASQDPGAPHTPLPYDRGYDKDSPRTDAINASGRADVAAANADVNAQSSATGGVDQAQYARDMADYRASLRARRHLANADMRRYDRQQRAYADAMADWRAQVYACRHGSNRACNAPTPNPADYE